MQYLEKDVSCFSVEHCLESNALSVTIVHSSKHKMGFETFIVINFYI